MLLSTRRFLSALSALAVAAGSSAALAATVSAASGSDVVSYRNFDAEVYEILLEQADENGDGELNEYELSLITDLDLSGLGLTSLKGMQYLPNLSWLDASDNELKSVSSIGRCDYLTWLDLSDNNITSLSGITKLDKLTELNLANNSLSTVSSLRNLNELETLDLSGNKMTSSSSLAGADSLRELVLDDNNLREIDDLPESLTYLSARNNRISDFRLITFSDELEYLDLSGNEITSIPNMTYLTGLKYCYLNDNLITDMVGGWVQEDCLVDLSRNLLDTNSSAVTSMYDTLTANGSTVRLVPQNLSGWQKEGDNTYYFTNENGSYATGTRTIDGISYTFDSYGVLNGSGSAPDSSTPSGSGWVNRDGTYYYQDENGALKKGWLYLDGTWYYLDPTSGAMGRERLVLHGPAERQDGGGLAQSERPVLLPEQLRRDGDRDPDHRRRQLYLQFFRPPHQRDASHRHDRTLYPHRQRLVCGEQHPVLPGRERQSQKGLALSGRRLVLSGSLVRRDENRLAAG